MVRFTSAYALGSVFAGSVFTKSGIEISSNRGILHTRLTIRPARVGRVELTPTSTKQGDNTMSRISEFLETLNVKIDKLGWGGQTI